MTLDPSPNEPADFVHSAAGCVLAIRFQRALTLESFERCQRLISATRKGAGKPILFVVVIPEGLPPLDGAVRKAVIGATPAMLRDCQSLDIALLGDGLVPRLSRTVLRGMVVATRSTSQIFLHDSKDQILKRLRDVDVRTALEFRGAS